MDTARAGGFDLHQVGRLLRERREEQGITVDQVSSDLFLTRSVVNALEAGNWDALPHPVYVKGYVMQYARLLTVCDEVRAEFVKFGTIQTHLLSDIRGDAPCLIS